MSASVPPPGFVPRAQQPVQSPATAPPPAPAQRARAKLLAAGAVVLAVGVAAFLLLGGRSGSGLSGPVAQAASVSSETAGYRMHMTVEVVSSASSTPITATGNAIVNLRDHATSMSFAMNFGDDPQVSEALGGDTLRMRMITSGDDIYVKLPAAAAAALPGWGNKWVRLDLAKLAGIPGLSSLEGNPATTDPAQMLELLRSESSVVLDEGHQMVDGFETTHYQAQIDLDRLADGLSGPAQQAFSKLQQLLPSGELPVDVWIDSAHLVRRIAMNLSLGPASGPSVQETMTADLSDYGPQPRPTTPPAGEVQDLSGLASSLGS